MKSFVFATAIVTSTLLLAVPSAAQQRAFFDATDTVECVLVHRYPGTLTGECTGRLPESRVVLERLQGTSDDWRGAITRGNHPTLGNEPILFEILAMPNGTSVPYIIRSTTSNWFNVYDFEINEAGGRLSYDQSDLVAPTEVDLEILHEARRILLTTSDWDREDDGSCENDEQGSIGLFCALIQATTASMGRYYHRQPAMARVRLVIEEKWRDRIAAHRLMDFNNHPDTTMDDIVSMIDDAISLVERDM
jgi:hypothetical protein